MLTEREMEAQVRAAIMAGESTPVREINARARVHEVRLSNGRVVEATYDRRTGDVKRIVMVT